MSLIANIKKNYNYLYNIVHADNQIFTCRDMKAIDKRVNLHVLNFKYVKKYSRFYQYKNCPFNLGDYLAIPICEFLLGKKSLQLDQPVSTKKHLITVGSSALGSFQNATLWGTGVQYDGLRGAWWEKYWDAEHRKLDIRAVRGPLSREVLLKLGHHCPEIYGDPAILMPLIYNPKERIKQDSDYCIIPQFVTEEEVRRYLPHHKIISMNTDDYKNVIDHICSCQRVYSSSLHGIILAEAYGIPAIFYRGLSAVIDFKYKDYYASTGRQGVPMANTLVEAMAMTPPPLPNLSNMQQALMEVFPYDLWD
ncbi:MAG: polysaccharide pyruvyl transferase family protein [Bacteroidales bacterium]|nr:polysaccharide pyruvyl transferase family protein [Bacteroidales bacterium]